MHVHLTKMTNIKFNTCFHNLHTDDDGCSVETCGKLKKIVFVFEYLNIVAVVSTVYLIF